MWGRLVLLCLYFAVVFCFKKPEKPCQRADDDCMTKLVVNIFEASVNDKTPGLETIDPMNLDIVMASLPSVNLTLKDTTVVGLKDLKIISAKNLGHDSVNITIMFPSYELSGTYEVFGNFLNQSLNGNGHFDLKGSDLRVQLLAMKQFYNKDGKIILKIKGFEFTSELVGKLHLEADNLFDGDKELSDAALKLINQNDKILAALWNPPITRANFEKIFVNVNKILEEVSTTDLLQEEPKDD